MRNFLNNLQLGIFYLIWNAGILLLGYLLIEALIKPDNPVPKIIYASIPVIGLILVFMAICYAFTMSLRFASNYFEKVLGLQGCISDQKAKK